MKSGKMKRPVFGTKMIENLVRQGKSMDSIYEVAAGHYGLFGVAFFGHRLKDRKTHRIAKAQLHRVWNRIVDVYHRLLDENPDPINSPDSSEPQTTTEAINQ